MGRAWSNGWLRSRLSPLRLFFDCAENLSDGKKVFRPFFFAYLLEKLALTTILRFVGKMALYLALA